MSHVSLTHEQIAEKPPLAEFTNMLNYDFKNPNSWIPRNALSQNQTHDGFVWL